MIVSEAGLVNLPVPYVTYRNSTVSMWCNTAPFFCIVFVCTQSMKNWNGVIKMTRTVNHSVLQYIYFQSLHGIRKQRGTVGWGDQHSCKLLIFLTLVFIKHVKGEILNSEGVTSRNNVLIINILWHPPNTWSWPNIETSVKQWQNVTDGTVPLWFFHPTNYNRYRQNSCKVKEGVTRV